jgi:Mn-dependent DtxR family transcriptional regulator
MSADGDDGTRTVKIAERLQVKPASLSPARQKLIDKGILFMPERGRIAFTVSNMASFIQRQYMESESD